MHSQIPKKNNYSEYRPSIGVHGREKAAESALRKADYLHSIGAEVRISTSHRLPAFLPALSCWVEWEAYKDSPFVGPRGASKSRPTVCAEIGVVRHLSHQPPESDLIDVNAEDVAGLKFTAQKPILLPQLSEQTRA